MRGGGGEAGGEALGAKRYEQVAIKGRRRKKMIIVFILSLRAKKVIIQEEGRGQGGEN